MVRLEYTTNADKIAWEINAFFLKMENLDEPINSLRCELPKLMTLRFKKFQKFKNTYRSKRYEEWKEAHKKPVGVKEGRLKEALTEHGDGYIDEVKKYPHMTELIYGVDEDKFHKNDGKKIPFEKRHTNDKWPLEFDAWLKERGMDLVDLDINDERNLSFTFFSEVDRIIEKYW